MEVHLKPQDVVVALKFVAMGDRKWTYPGLAHDLFISPSEVHAAVHRLEKCRLMNPIRHRVDKASLRSFLEHGVAHVFPATLAEETVGIPTAVSAAPLSTHFIVGDDLQMVWSCAEGSVRGRRVSPLYPTVPKAASRDPALHELLALVDALRVGRARERNLAAEELKRRIA